MISGRQRRAIFFTILGICLVAAAVTLNVSWLLINWRESVLIVFGSIFFLVIIAGVVVNTIFLVREIRRNEQHDSFINAVTHELKTPVASIRLHLQTLQMRELDETKRREFYRVMLEDSDRLLHTIDQVLLAGATGSILRRSAKTRLDLAQIARECVELARLQRLQVQSNRRHRRLQLVGDGVDEGIVLLVAPDLANEENRIDDHAGDDHQEEDRPEHHHDRLAPVQDQPADVQRDRGRDQADAEDREEDGLALAAGYHGSVRIPKHCHLSHLRLV